MNSSKIVTYFSTALLMFTLSGCGRNSDPKSVLITVGDAMKRGDAAAVKANTINGDPHLIDAMANMSANSTKLHDAAAAKFGADADALGAMKIPDIAKQVADADVKQDGDDATVTPKTGEPLKLKRVNGEWKLDFGQMPFMSDMSQALPMMQTMSDTNSQVADEITAGKYATAADAKKALDEKMMASFTSNLGGAMPAAPK